MKRIGDYEMHLADGPVPHYKELKELSRSIIKLLLYEFGTEELIKRFSNPLWFNSYACLLGFEWNYSGMTTVTLKALKEIVREENLELIALGGKGKNSNIKKELENIDIKDKLKDKFSESSIISAKVDNYLLQDGYDLYFHFLIGDEKGNFTIINQKMNIVKRKVRRFHWLNTEDYFKDPQIGFGYNELTLNLSSSESESIRNDIVYMLNNENKEKIKNYIIRLQNYDGTNNILKYINKEEYEKFNIFYQELPYHFRIPRKIYLKALDINKTLESFKDILFLKGFGPGMIRALAYTANLLYGDELSWKDPIIYTFAHGTKAGKPYYVNKKLMLEEAEIIKNAIEEAKIGNNFKLRAIRNLQKLVDFRNI